MVIALLQLPRLSASDELDTDIWVQFMVQSVPMGCLCMSPCMWVTHALHDLRRISRAWGSAVDRSTDLECLQWVIFTYQDILMMSSPNGTVVPVLAAVSRDVLLAS